MPAAQNFSRFQAHPPGDTQLVAFAIIFNSAFGVGAYHSIIPTYSKQACAENLSVQEQLLLSHTLLEQRRTFDLPCQKTILLWAAAVFRDDSNIALSSLMVLKGNKNVKVIRWKTWVGLKILTLSDMMNQEKQS